MMIMLFENNKQMIRTIKKSSIFKYLFIFENDKQLIRTIKKSSNFTVGSPPYIYEAGVYYWESIELETVGSNSAVTYYK